MLAQFVESLEIGETFDRQGLRIALTFLATFPDESFECRAPLVILVDVIIDQQINTPGPREGEARRILIRHQPFLFSRYQEYEKSFGSNLYRFVPK
jgi:hypothetical protein